MPPRKSTASVADADTTMDTNAPVASTATPDKKEAQKEKEKDKDRDSLGVEDLGLPKTMVQRLAKGVLPPNTQIQKDAQTAIWRSATVFVNYLASSANENAHRANKKTILPQDVLDAIKDLEFNAFIPRLEAELAKHNALQSEKRNSYRKKVRDETSTSTPGAEADASTTTANGKARSGLVQASHRDNSTVSSRDGSPAGGIPFDNPYAAPASGPSNQASRGGAVGASGAGHPNAAFDNVAVVIPPTVKAAAAKQKQRRDEEPSVAKKARRNTIGEGEAVDLQDDGDMNDMNDEEDEDVDVEDDEEFEDDEEEEDDDEAEDPVQRLAEDPLEEREEGDDGDEAMDGEDSD